MPRRFIRAAFPICEVHMRLDWQTQVAVLECDRAIPQAERERILAELQAMGIRGMILPQGVTLAHVADQGLEPDSDDDD